jgi:hypothetical protein
MLKNVKKCREKLGGVREYLEMSGNADSCWIILKYPELC